MPPQGGMPEMPPMPQGDDPVDPLAGLSDLQWLDHMNKLGIDVPSLLGADDENEDPTRDKQAPPGEGKGTITLSPEDELELATDLCDLLDRHDAAMRGHHDQEAEIRDSYDRIPDPTRGGSSIDSSQMVAGLTKSLTDQATARLTTNVTSIDPLIRVVAIQGEDDDASKTQEMAEACEPFINEYFDREVKFNYTLPRMIHRAVKVGEAVCRLTWVEEPQIVFEYGTNGVAKRKETKVGKVEGTLIDNPHVILWPPDLADWQTGYQVVGHNVFLSRSAWRATAKRLKLDQETIDSIEVNPGEEDRAAIKEAQRHGVSLSQMSQQDLISPQVMLTELYCNLCLPNAEAATKFHLILHRPTRKITWIGYNEFHSQKHPYFPLRYELQDAFGHGKGVGHDVLYNQAAADALWNLELDNLFSGAYNITLRKAGTAYKTANQPLRPGAEIEVDNMDDIQTMSMGGQAVGILESKGENLQDARETSGMASVLSGMGDPVMKSGAGTGSTNALIEQASMKIRLIDQNMRTDLGAMYMFGLELVAQYAPDGLFYRYASDDNAQTLQRLKWTPPRRQMSEVFHLRAQAPSITSSDDARKQLAITVWGFAIQQVQALSQQVIPVLQAENPSAVTRWQRSCAEYLSAIGQAVVTYTDLPGVKNLTPQIPDPVPEDQLVQQLNQSNQQLQQQLQQVQKELDYQMTHGARSGLREQINYKDLPPELQSSLAEQAGLAGQQGGDQGGGQGGQPPQPGAQPQPQQGQAPMQPPQPGGGLPQ